MSIETIKQISKNIRCFGFVQSAESRILQARQSGDTYEEFLLKILQDEQEDRQQKTAKRMLRSARFRRTCTLEDWDMSYDRGISKGKLKELALLSFYNNRENLIVLGPTGSGKSHLAIAVGRRLCNQGTSVKFFSLNHLFEEFQAHRASGKYLSFIKQLAKADVIVLDDFGLRNYTHDEALTLLDLIEDRYQKGVLIITSQVKPEGWRSLFEDPVIAEALTDRLVNPCMEIQLRGESYRTKIAAANRNQLEIPTGNR